MSPNQEFHDILDDIVSSVSAECQGCPNVRLSAWVLTEQVVRHEIAVPEGAKQVLSSELCCKVGSAACHDDR